MARVPLVAPAALGAFLALAVTSCATGPGPRMAWSWFASPPEDDAWSPAVGKWQARAGTGTTGAASEAARKVAEVAEEPPTLALAYLEFQRERRRETARQVTEWIQAQAREHFVSDGAEDRWATLEEVLATNGDDCDGLALLSYHLLREFGFAEGELYQAIVFRAEDAQYHMVTLWFEDDSDPWVIDPTAAMTEPMVRMSSIPDWRPLKIFTEEEEYTVRRARLPAVASPPPASRSPQAPEARAARASGGRQSGGGQAGAGGR